MKINTSKLTSLLILIAATIGYYLPWISIHTALSFNQIFSGFDLLIQSINHSAANVGSVGRVSYMISAYPIGLLSLAIFSFLNNKKAFLNFSIICMMFGLVVTTLACMLIGAGGFDGPTPSGKFEIGYFVSIFSVIGLVIFGVRLKSR